MSIQSLNNGQLQLSELVISNEKYTGATGYVASTSSFSSSVDGTSLTVPEISASSITSFGSISAATFSTTNAGTSIFDNISAVGSVSVTGNITSTAGNISAVGLKINNSTGIDAFILQNLTTGFSAVPAGAGVTLASAGFTTANVPFSLLAGATYATVYAFAGGVTTANGASLILSQIYVTAPSNGLDGYCNVETVWINVSGAAITPTSVKILLLSY